MQTALSPADLGDDDLLHEAARLVRAAHEATAALVRVLMEVDRRRLYLRAGCSSLFVWCVQVLHLDEGAAYNRIEVARAARRHPAVIDALDHGGVSLTAARLLAPHLTVSNHVDVLARASGRTTRAIHLLVAELAPRPVVPSSIRRLPSVSGSPTVLEAAPPHQRPASDLAPLLDEASAVSGPAPECARAESESAPGPVRERESERTPGPSARGFRVSAMADGARQTGGGTDGSSATAPGADGTAPGAAAEAGAVSEAVSQRGSVTGEGTGSGTGAGTGPGMGAGMGAGAAAVTEANSVAGAAAGAKAGGVPGARSAAPTGALPGTAAHAAVVPLSPVHFKLQMTITSETHAKLRHAQNLLRHTMPGGDLADIVDRALTVLVRELERQRWARTETPRPAARHTRRRSGRPSAESRHIPSFVRRAVWQRDEGRCAFVGPHGRCHERGWLEFHHVTPFAAGGPASVENISLRCRAHNAHEGAVFFGKDPQPRRRKVSDTTG